MVKQESINDYTPDILILKYTSAKTRIQPLPHDLPKNIVIFFSGFTIPWLGMSIIPFLLLCLPLGQLFLRKGVGKAESDKLHLSRLMPMG